jgi:hypothetical protein
MSTFLQCPFEWNKLAVSASAFGLVVFTSIFASGRPSQLGKSPDKGGSPSSFLEIFQKNAEPPIITKDVLIESAVGRVRGYLARPGTPDNLPGVLLLPNEAGLTDWMRENARDLASVGYVALAIEPSRRGLHRAVSGLADSVALFNFGAAVGSRSLAARPCGRSPRSSGCGWLVARRSGCPGLGGEHAAASLRYL